MNTREIPNDLIGDDDNENMFKQEDNLLQQFIGADSPSSRVMNENDENSNLIK